MRGKKGGLSVDVLCSRVRILLMLIELFIPPRPQGLTVQLDMDTKEHWHVAVGVSV